MMEEGEEERMGRGGGERNGRRGGKRGGLLSILEQAKEDITPVPVMSEA